MTFQHAGSLTVHLDLIQVINALPLQSRARADQVDQYRKQPRCRRDHPPDCHTMSRPFHQIIKYRTRKHNIDNQKNNIKPQIRQLVPVGHGQPVFIDLFCLSTIPFIFSQPSLLLTKILPYNVADPASLHIPIL